MKKDNVRIGLIALIALALYHMVIFMIPFDRETTAFWLAYGFTWAGFIVAGVSIYIGIMQNPTAKGRFYGFPVVRQGLIHAGIQTVAGLVLMIIGDVFEWWIPTLLFSGLLAFGIVKLIAAESTLDHIQTMDGRLKAQVSRMRNLQSKVLHMEAQCADADASKAVKALAEEMRYSDPVSSAAVAEVENELSALIDALQDAVADGEAVVIVKLCAKASAILAERNRICKLNK